MQREASRLRKGRDEVQNKLTRTKSELDSAESNVALQGLEDNLRVCSGLHCDYALNSEPRDGDGSCGRRALGASTRLAKTQGYRQSIRCGDGRLRSAPCRDRAATGRTKRCSGRSAGTATCGRQAGEALAINARKAVGKTGLGASGPGAETAGGEGTCLVFRETRRRSS